MTGVGWMVEPLGSDEYTVIRGWAGWRGRVCLVAICHNEGSAQMSVCHAAGGGDLGGADDARRGAVDLVAVLLEEVDVETSIGALVNGEIAAVFVFDVSSAKGFGFGEGAEIEFKIVHGWPAGERWRFPSRLTHCNPWNGRQGAGWGQCRKPSHFLCGGGGLPGSGSAHGVGVALAAFCGQAPPADAADGAAVDLVAGAGGGVAGEAEDGLAVDGAGGHGLITRLDERDGKAEAERSDKRRFNISFQAFIEKEC